MTAFPPASRCARAMAKASPAAVRLTSLQQVARVSPGKRPSISPFLRQFLRFSCVGTVSFVVDAATLTAVLAVSPGHFYLGRVLSYLAAASAGWWLNRRFTFGAGGPMRRQWLRYLVANLGGGVANYAIYAALIAYVPPVRLHPTLAVAAGSLAGLVINFAASRRFVFGERGKAESLSNAFDDGARLG